MAGDGEGDVCLKILFELLEFFEFTISYNWTKKFGVAGNGEEGLFKLFLVIANYPEFPDS
jgi:hypothetical protein